MVVDERFYSIVSRAIRDFDSIQGALVLKSTDINGSATLRRDSLLPTRNMSEIIESELWRVGTRRGNVVNNSLGVIPDYEYRGFSLGNTYSVTTSFDNENKFTLRYSRELTTPGYYGNNDISINLDKASVTLTSSLLAGSIDTQLRLVQWTEENKNDIIPIYLNGTINETALQNIPFTSGYLDSRDQITRDEWDQGRTFATVYVNTLSANYKDTSTGNDIYQTDTGKQVSDTVYIAGTLGSLSGELVDDIDAISVAKQTDTAESNPGARNTIFINTAEKYAKYDVKITLTEDAMGSRVMDRVKALRSRIDGDRYTFLK